MRPSSSAGPWITVPTLEYPYFTGAGKSPSWKGARIVSRDEVFAGAELVVKVKEPLPEEYELLREGQILYTYLHLAPARELTEALLRRKIIAIAYETVQNGNGSLPLLIPMSEVAGRMSIHEGAKC